MKDAPVVIVAAALLIGVWSLASTMMTNAQTRLNDSRATLAIANAQASATISATMFPFFVFGIIAMIVLAIIALALAINLKRPPLGRVVMTNGHEVLLVEGRNRRLLAAEVAALEDNGYYTVIPQNALPQQGRRKLLRLEHSLDD